MKTSLKIVLVASIAALTAGATLAASFLVAPLRPAPVRTGPPPAEVLVKLKSSPGQTPGAFSVTRIAHASVLLDFGNATVLTDPWFSEKMHYHQGEPLGVALERLPKLTAVVISHEHYDQCRLLVKQTGFLIHMPNRDGTGAKRVFTGLTFENLTVAPPFTGAFYSARNKMIYVVSFQMVL